jgi:hypothetical protein
MVTIDSIRSLGFGGLIGAGLLGLIYAMFPNLIELKLSIDQVMIIGAMIGSGGHTLINNWFIRTFLSPVRAFIGYYSAIIQLSLMRNKIGDRQCKKILRELTYKYFLGRAENGLMIENKTFSHRSQIEYEEVAHSDNSK